MIGSQKLPSTAGDQALVRIASALEKIVKHLDETAAEKKSDQDEKQGL